jgi:hypothetical protein
VLQIPSRTVLLTMKTGVEARDYAEVAKKENLKPLEIELRKIEDAAERLKNDMLYMKQRGKKKEREEGDRSGRVKENDMLYMKQ